MAQQEESKIRHTPEPLHNVWVKSGKRGIKVIEKFGFQEVMILNAPNEMHIESFIRWIRLLSRKLGIKILDEPEEI